MDFQLTRSVVLVGMMGCGKSSVGLRLAQKIELPFIDLDKYIENAQNKTITEIFKSDGEEYFRKLEQNYTNDILNSKLCVLATGGGAFINEKTRQAIKKYGLSIYLRTEFNILLDRVSKKDTRPLLEQGDKAEILADLMKIRCPIYEQADLIVESYDEEHDDVVKRILNSIKRYKKQVK